MKDKRAGTCGLQQREADRVQARSRQRAREQSFDMSPRDDQDTIDEAHRTHRPHRSDRRRDDRDHLGAFGLLDLDRDLIA